MSDRIYIPYSGDPVQAIEQAQETYGEDKAFILVPAELWDRFVPKSEQQRRECRPQQMELFK